MKLPMFENGDGKRDFLLTVSAVTVAVVLAKVLVSGFTFGKEDFGTIDAATIGALLLPTLGAYTTKRVMLAQQVANAMGEGPVEVSGNVVSQAPDAEESEGRKPRSVGFR